MFSKYELFSYTSLQHLLAARFITQKLKVLLAVWLCACLISMPINAAGVPEQLSIQGVVNDSASGLPVDGILSVRFTLYDGTGRTTLFTQAGGGFTDPTGLGASVIWTEVQQVEFSNGAYAVLLGEDPANPLPADAFQTSEVSIGIQIDSDTELSPRMTLGSVPYAFKSSESDNAIGNITPSSVSVINTLGQLTPVIDGDGNWLGEAIEGAEGVEGPEGPAGEIGPEGPAGEAGPEGVAGPEGPQGPAGATGPQGLAGTAAAQGDPGAQGPQGDTGATGPQGETGLQGPQGDTGAQGPQGETGTAGAQGVAGAQGPQGDTGVQGPQGDTGAQGPQGETGAAGAQGVAGAQGPQGDTGAQGPQGDAGAAGAQGVAGVQGPQGDTGAQGPQGSTGDTGAQGIAGATGPQGDTGAQGPQGDTGAQGPQGDTGAQGPQGDTGAQGPQGDTGATGAQGPQGIAGATGPAGPTGAQGLKGDTGATGATGSAGASGASHTGAIYRWNVFSTYDQAHGFIADNNSTIFGGINPSAWTDTGATADQLGTIEQVRGLFTRKGYGGKNANVVADTWAHFSSTNGKMAVALFRIKNTTGAPVIWTVQTFQTAYPTWGERASVALNGASFWSSASNSLSAKVAQTHAISVPASGTSTIVFTAGSAMRSSDPGGTRTVFLAFYNDSLELPAGLEYVDDLDVATAYFE